MLDVKPWLEQTGLKVAETAFQKSPPLPFIVFLDTQDQSGADFRNCIVSREITIELYSNKVDAVNEKKIKDLLHEKSIAYKKERIWHEGEKHYQTIFDFNLYEKI
jgi:hypothetical protein